jgi:diguanylate cyclase (GGDEF)-like protein
MMLRFIVPLALIVMAATVVCAGLAFVVARQSDDRYEAEQQQALRDAVKDLRAAVPELSALDPRLISLLERVSGLSDLRFEATPTLPDRRLQSVVDENGRIVGWFSWEPKRPASSAMSRLLPVTSVIAVGLVGFGGLALWQLKRLGFLLAKTERHARKLERDDQLTDLPNHSELLALLDRAIAARQSDETLMFAVLDLDGFDDVNDAVGRTGGDQMLAEIGKRLRESVPRDAAVGRVGGDEFALVMTSKEPETLQRVAEAARVTASRAFWMNQLVQVSVSAGWAMAPRDGVTRDELTRRADLALREAKRLGRGRAVSFVAGMEAEFRERVFMKRELSRALSKGHFDVHYQPIVTADGSAIAGVEALLRWQHPARGYIAPAEFIPVAEEAGLMDRLGEFVLRRALTDVGRWSDLYVSVNVSPVQMRDRGFVDVVAKSLAETKVRASRLVLEMTEGVLVDNREETRARLEQLRALGVRLALDDFGAGYSSLGYLQHLPFDKLKIDRSFVTGLNRSANGGVIIQAIVALGRALGMGVVVEGVETEEQRVLLRLAGCNEMQGFLFAKAAPREAIDELLAAAGAADAAKREPMRIRAG